MNRNEEALYAQMQELGYSHGTCITALRILSPSAATVSDMLVYLYDEQPTEEAFIREVARICEG